MTFDEIRDAIESRMSDWVMGTATPPVAYDNAPVLPAVVTAQNNKDTWLRLSIIDGDSFTACIGDRPEPRRTGVIMLEIYGKRGVGTATVREVADSLAAHFEYWQEGKLSTNAGRIVNVPAETNYYRRNFVIGFTAD